MQSMSGLHFVQCDLWLLAYSHLPCYLPNHIRPAEGKIRRNEESLFQRKAFDISFLISKTNVGQDIMKSKAYSVFIHHRYRGMNALINMICHICKEVY